MLGDTVVRKLCLVSILVCVGVASGCTTVPRLDEDGIAVSAIVHRIKCEIAFAIPEPQGKYPTGPYQWTKYWTAKAELTLKTNSKSTISPSAVLNKVWPDFTLGLNGSFETGADRTEVMTFSLSFADMLKFKRSGECDLPDAPGLYGNLGLREWVRAAFAPVEDGVLKVGYQPAPGGKTSLAPPVIRLETFRADDSELIQLKKSADLLVGRAQQAEKYSGSAKAHVNQFYSMQIRIAKLYKQSPVDRKKIAEHEEKANNNRQLAYEDAGRLLKIFEEAESESAKVSTVYPILLERYPENGNDDQKLINKQVVEHKKRADKASVSIANIKNGDTLKIVKELPHDPPITTISHSVNFSVEMKGGVSPNWTLVSVRGPASSGSLLSGAHTRTHTLSIAMGHPGEAPEELSRQLSTLAIIQSFRSLGVAQ
jgi:hypothetical protein